MSFRRHAIKSAIGRTVEVTRADMGIHASGPIPAWVALAVGERATGVQCPTFQVPPGARSNFTF